MASLALLIPAYNAAAHLPRLLASAAAQTEPFDEIWVYDDASTDDTAGVAEQLGAKVVRGAVNRGCSAGKNILASETNAGWVHFHDADDELSPNFVWLARRWMAEGRHDVVLFAYEERDEASGRTIATRRFDPADAARDARSYAIREQINPFCGLYRRDAFLAAGGYDEDPKVLFNEDVAMHIQLAFAGLSFAAETEVAIINHRRAGSMSASNQLRCIQAHYEVLRKAAERAGASEYAQELASKLWKAAGVLAAYLDWKHADAAATLARELLPSQVEGSPAFRALARISPPAALRLREHAIRIVRPILRAGYPSRAHEQAPGVRAP
jgi:glycosyltransferase involved in cell wall biosynthesis